MPNSKCRTLEFVPVTEAQRLPGYDNFVEVKSRSEEEHKKAEDGNYESRRIQAGGPDRKRASVYRIETRPRGGPWTPPTVLEIAWHG